MSATMFSLPCFNYPLGVVVGIQGSSLLLAPIWLLDLRGLGFRV